jgi:hypothetical protein
MGNAQKILIGKPERKRIIQMPRRKLEDNIQVNLKKNGALKCGLEAVASG